MLKKIKGITFEMIKIQVMDIDESGQTVGNDDSKNSESNFVDNGYHKKLNLPPFKIIK